MSERRKELRSRTLLGGVIAFNERRSTLECSVRNLSERGARIEFTDTALLPDSFDLTVVRKQTTFRASTVWRTQAAAGVRFIDARESGVVPLDWARKVRALEAQNEALRQHVTQLGEGTL
jgi:PilZ domain